MNKIKNITFRQFVENCEELKFQYKELLTPFFNTKMVRIWKIMIYSLQIETWRKDKIWEYLNDDEHIDVLKKLI
jgi:hypothetical protein